MLEKLQTIFSWQLLLVALFRSQNCKTIHVFNKTGNSSLVDALSYIFSRFNNKFMYCYYIGYLKSFKLSAKSCSEIIHEDNLLVDKIFRQTCKSSSPYLHENWNTCKYLQPFQLFKCLKTTLAHVISFFIFG